MSVYELLTLFFIYEQCVQAYACVYMCVYLYVCVFMCAPVCMSICCLSLYVCVMLVPCKCAELRTTWWTWLRHLTFWELQVSNSGHHVSYQVCLTSQLLHQPISQFSGPFFVFIVFILAYIEMGFIMESSYILCLAFIHLSLSSSLPFILSTFLFFLQLLNPSLLP